MGTKTPAGSNEGAPTAAAPPTTYSEGQLIGGKYRLLRRLGEGGMASVWAAHNQALDIDVAIKFVRTDLSHEGLSSRLRQEAHAAARLGHPAIVRISDFGTTDGGDPYIVMELLNGEDLAATIKRRGALPPLKAVRTLLPIADALAAAHAKRIVHRDLKPENVFLATTEEHRTQPKLVDFGIAKLEREDAQRITQMGATMGSPAYMSPEQARGLDVDARTDIWSFSVVLYQALTRKLPYNGASYSALVCSILESEPKSIMEHGILEPQLWSLIARGFSKDPEQRWPSMKEYGAALARWALARGVRDDVSGTSLLSSYVERRNDSAPPGPNDDAISPSASGAVGAASLGDHAATQLSATVANQAGRKRRSGIAVAVVGVILVLAVLVVFAARAALKPEENSAAAPERSAAPVTVLEPLAPSATAQPAAPEVKPQVPEPEQSSTAVEQAPTAPKKAAKSSVVRKPKGSPKPAAPSSTASAKPAVKPPDLDIKTQL